MCEYGDAQVIGCVRVISYNVPVNTERASRVMCE